MSLSVTDDTVTHKDLAQLLGVSETTIKNYRSKFSEFFEVRGKGKPLRFATSAAELCRDIRNALREGLSVEQTRARLRERHPRVGSRRRESEASAVPPQTPPELSTLIPSLAGGLERLALLQDETNQRLERLEFVLAGRLAAGSEEGSTLEEVRSMLALWLAGREEGQAGEGEAGRGGRLVRVRNAYGEVQEYHLEAASPSSPATDPAMAPVSGPPSAPAPLLPPVANKAASPHPPEKDRLASPFAGKGEQEGHPDTASGPPLQFLNMPLVVRSGRGEYLGVGGRGAGPFSTTELMRLMAKGFASPKTFAFRWEAREGGHAGWLLRAVLGQGHEAKLYCLGLERAKTPRGNEVVLVWSLEVDGKEVSPLFLHNFIKQMRGITAPRKEER